MMPKSSAVPCVPLVARSLMLLSFVRNPQRLKLAIEMLATVPRCTVSHEEEPQLSGNIGSAVLPSAVVILADHTRLDECCNVIRRLRGVWPTTPQLVLTDDVDADGLLRLLECGAFDFADLRASSAWTVLRIQRVLGMLPSRSATDDKGRDALRVNPATCGGLIGDAPEFVKLLKRLPVIARTNANVLLLGETGTGKEVCAHAIHYSSPRAQGPWVAINCAAIPAGLLESELFGHVRGAFTEAHTARVGLVPEASGGTLFLDEIDSLPLAAQAKLLRFLQDGEYRVLGSSTARHVDVRIIAASNCDLGFAAVKGHFRQDLYYRLNVLSMTMPPLRARREDIPALASYFLEQACRDAGKRVTGISSAAMHRLMTHEWPGNVRELKHAIERAVLLAEETLLHVGDIELDGTAQAAEAPLSFRDAKARAVEAFERRYLEQLLLQAGGNISHAARAAHKNRRALFELLRRHAIDASRFRMS